MLSPGLTHSLCALYSLDLLLFPQSVSREEGQVLEYHLHYFPDAHPVSSPKSCVAPLAGARGVKGIQCAELQAAMLDWGAAQPSPSPAPDKRAQSPNPRHSALLEPLYSEKAPGCLGFFFFGLYCGPFRDRVITKLRSGHRVAIPQGHRCEPLWMCCREPGPCWRFQAMPVVGLALTPWLRPKAAGTSQGCAILPLHGGLQAFCPCPQWGGS